MRSRSSRGGPRPPPGKTQLLLRLNSEAARDTGTRAEGACRQSRGASVRGHAAARLGTSGTRTQAAASERARAGGPRGKAASILRPQQATHQATNWKQPSRPPVTGEQASEAPASRGEPRMPGEETPPPAGWCCGWASAWALVPWSTSSPSQVPRVQDARASARPYPGPRQEPRAQSPAPRVAAPKERAFQDTNNALGLAPTGPRVLHHQQLGAGPRPHCQKGTREHTECAPLARVPWGRTDPG